jgi:hypothetical protein
MQNAPGPLLQDVVLSTMDLRPRISTESSRLQNVVGAMRSLKYRLDLV